MDSILNLRIQALLYIFTTTSFSTNFLSDWLKQRYVYYSRPDLKKVIVSRAIWNISHVVQKDFSYKLIIVLPEYTSKVRRDPFIHKISNFLLFAFFRARHPASAAHSVGGHTLYIVLYWTMSFVNESLLFLLATHMHETMKAFSSNMTTIENVLTAEWNAKTHNLSFSFVYYWFYVFAHIWKS